jgi:hypothetical protein
MLQRPIREPPDGGLVINCDGWKKTVPYPYSIEGAGDIKFRVKDDAKAFNHGASVVGDGKADSRKLKIGLYIRAETEEEHDKALNDIYALFARRDYTIAAGRSDRVYRVAALTEIKHKFIKGFKGRRSDIDVSLLLADPFRHAAQPAKMTYALGGDVQTARLHNPGSADTPLTLTLIPAATMADVTIHHRETGSICRVRDSLLTAPASLTADTRAGAVRRGELNAVNSFSGQFMIALPGLNHYEVTSAAGVMEITFTARWLI